MTKLYEVVCWIAVVIIAIWMVVYMVSPLSSLFTVVWMFIHSGLSLWVLIPAAAAIVAGILSTEKQTTQD